MAERETAVPDSQAGNLSSQRRKEEPAEIQAGFEQGRVVVSRRSVETTTPKEGVVTVSDAAEGQERCREERSGFVRWEVLGGRSMFTPVV